MLRVLQVGCVILMCLFMLPAFAEYPVAGINPSQRPVGAPVIEWVRHKKEWFAHALTGVQKPYPKNLYFLNSQGHWYTPFNQPGMLGRYDIRGWHEG